VRNDPFFAVEVFENLIEFHSLALPERCLCYELPEEERLISFAEASEKKDIEESRAFYLVVEKGEKLWLRRVVVSHEQVLGGEELRAEDLLSLDRPAEAPDHALLVKDKLYLKSESQILVANEGLVPFPAGLKFKTNLVYSPGHYGGLKCLGQLQGVTHEVDVLKKLSKPDPTASAIGLFGDIITKVYPAAAHYLADRQDWFHKKPTSRLSPAFHDCAFANRDLFQGGV